MGTTRRRTTLAAAAALVAAPSIVRTQTLPVLRSIRATPKSWLWIAEDYANALGAFEKAGVKIESTVSGRGVNIDAVISNAVEILLGAPTVTMRVQVQRQPVKMICGMVNKYASHVVVKREILDKLGVSEASPFLDKCRALRGLRMGTTGPGAAPDFLLRWMLTRVGLNPDTEAQLVTIQGGGPAMLAALERGNVIDGFCLSSPTSDLAVMRSGAAHLVNMTRNPPPEFADYLYIAATTSDRLLAERGPQFIAYCKGIGAALHAIRADHAAFKTWSKGFFGDMDPTVFERSFESDGNMFLADPRISEIHFKQNLAMLNEEFRQRGAQPAPAEFGYAQAVDARFAEAAMRG